MTTIFTKKSIIQWCRLTLLIYFCYNLLWLPVMFEEENFTWPQTINSIAIDLIVCGIISFINCIVLSILQKRLELSEWTNKRIGFMILGIVLFNLAVCFPFSVVKWWLYDKIFHNCPWDLGENWLDNYVMTSVISIIIVSHMLIWVSSALRQKEKILAEVKIKSLKNQINPHFLFNNLNAGIALIDYAPDKAVDFFTSMSRVFRTVLDHSMESTQSIQAEIKDLRQYLNLIRIRFGDAIKIDYWLSETEMQQHILCGSLQLVLENIVKHNRFSAEEPITVSVLTRADSLVIVNDYRPISKDVCSHGIGQSAIIHRYEDFGKGNVSFYQDGDKYISQLPLFPAK